MMKRIYLMIVAAAIFSACGNHHDHDHEGHSHEAEISDEHGDRDEHHEDGEIVMHPERAEQLGVVAKAIEPSQISETIAVTGELVSDPSARGVVVAPVAGKVVLGKGMTPGKKLSKGAAVASIDAAGINGGDAAKAAKIRLETAKAELDRLTPLHEKGIVTKGEYNAAVEAYELARNAMVSSGSNAVAPISGTMTTIEVENGQYVEAGQPIATVTAEGDLIVRADVPKRFAPSIGSVTHAVVRNSRGESADATITSAPTTSTADRGYIPLYFTIEPAGSFHTGDFVDVYLAGKSDREGLVVPIEAIVEKLGQKFVYVKLDDECYERRPVETGSDTGSGVEILSGIEPGEEVVVEGTTFIRLAETATVAPEGHHHH